MWRSVNYIYQSILLRIASRFSNWVLLVQPDGPLLWNAEFTFFNCIYVHALNPLLPLKLTDKRKGYDSVPFAQGPAESTGKLLISPSFMDQVTRIMIVTTLEFTLTSDVLDFPFTWLQCELRDQFTRKTWEKPMAKTIRFLVKMKKIFPTEVYLLMCIFRYIVR